jgi:hypothetical protein
MMKGLMSPTCIEPELETPVEEIEESVPSPVPSPQNTGANRRLRNVLTAIFEGHEEFLGWTPD